MPCSTAACAPPPRRVAWAGSTPSRTCWGRAASRTHTFSGRPPAVTTISTPKTCARCWRRGCGPWFNPRRNHRNRMTDLLPDVPLFEQPGVPPLGPADETIRRFVADMAEFGGATLDLGDAAREICGRAIADTEPYFAVQGVRRVQDA